MTTTGAGAETIAADMPAAAGTMTTVVPAVMTTTTGGAATEAGSATLVAMPKLPVADGTSAGKIVIMMTGAAIPAARTTMMIAAPDMTTMTADGVGMAIPVVTRKPHGADGTSDAIMIMTTVADIPAAAGMTTIAAPAVMRTTTGVVATEAGSVIPADTRKLHAGDGTSAGTMTTAIAAAARVCLPESGSRFGAANAPETGRRMGRPSGRPAGRAFFSRNFTMGAKATRELDVLAEKARLRYLRARNMLILEAAISALLDTETPQDAAKTLREQADLLVRYL